MNKWCIYYGDGSIFRDCDGLPEDAPRRNVQVITVEDDLTGIAFVRMNDYYWWDNDNFEGGDMFGLFDYLLRPGLKLVLFGRTISTREYSEIVNRATTDDGYMPRKSAWQAKEKRVDL